MVKYVITGGLGVKIKLVEDSRSVRTGRRRWTYGSGGK